VELTGPPRRSEQPGVRRRAVGGNRGDWRLEAAGPSRQAFREGPLGSNQESRLAPEKDRHSAPLFVGRTRGPAPARPGSTPRHGGDRDRQRHVLVPERDESLQSVEDDLDEAAAARRLAPARLRVANDARAEHVVIRRLAVAFEFIETKWAFRNLRAWRGGP